MYCAEGGTNGETLCSYGKAPLQLTIEASGVVAGQPARLKAVAAQPAGTLVKCEWDPGDGQPREETGPELTHVYERGNQQYRASVSCTDASGRQGSTDVLFEASCQPSTGACAPSACCAESGFHCLTATSGEGNVCRMPLAPVLTVSGPNPIPIHTTGEYTASASGGEGELRYVTWSFSDSSFTRQGITVNESFSKVGIVMVKARGSTSLGQAIQADYAVTVCQVQNGTCSESASCCAPLTCQTSGSTKRCLP
jgi:hypothetical protein